TIDILYIFRSRRVSSSSVLLKLFFFFSSRRRHTRSKRDWSSDVCSSDLSSICNNGIIVSNPMLLLKSTNIYYFHLFPSKIQQIYIIFLFLTIFSSITY